MCLLEMVNIHKRFPGVYALRGVHFKLLAGQVHALVGENGAGKSTLINVLGGIHPRDEGQILMDGKDAGIRDVLSARNAGVSIIHQELVLVPHLTVAENIFLNREPDKFGAIDFSALFQRAQDFIDELGLDLRANQKVIELTIAQQQMVEIVKAISFNARIIVMDEPTSSLSDREIEALFSHIRMLRERGIGIVYISHRLSELQQIADMVTVLRDGQSIATMKMADTNNDEIVRLMVGREMTSYYSRTYFDPGEVVLSVQGITSNKVRDVSFQVRAGEILGFAGLVGAGRTEAMKAILGFDALTGGDIQLSGKPVVFKNPSEAYRAGIGYIPENRREEGLIPMQSIRFNTTLKVLDQFIHGIAIDSRTEEELTEMYIDMLSIRTPSQLARVQNLSGGNQQKVVIAGSLATRPKLLIMDEPTRGVDVGAKAEIYSLMNELVAKGMAIVMISSELPEIINMSDRIAVMRGGTISKVLDRENITQEEIMKHAVNL